MPELRLIAKDENCLSEATCISISEDEDGKQVFVIGRPVDLPPDAPCGVGPGEAAVVIPTAVLDQALAAAGRQIAYRIRAELVCCRVFHRVNDRSVSKEERTRRFREFERRGTHDLCYWGEAAALVAETPEQWKDDPSDHDWSQPDLEERWQARERRRQ